MVREHTHILLLATLCIIYWFVKELGLWLLAMGKVIYIYWIITNIGSVREMFISQLNLINIPFFLATIVSSFVGYFLILFMVTITHTTHCTSREPDINYCVNCHNLSLSVHRGLWQKTMPPSLWIVVTHISYAVTLRYFISSFLYSWHDKTLGVL